MNVPTHSDFQKIISQNINNFFYYYYYIFNKTKSLLKYNTIINDNYYEIFTNNKMLYSKINIFVSMWISKLI